MKQNSIRYIHQTETFAIRNLSQGMQTCSTLMLSLLSHGTTNFHR